MPLGEEAILGILLRKLAAEGLIDVTLAVGYMADLIAAYCRDGSPFGVRLTYSLETTPLGTVGPLAHVQGLDDTFVVMNGDLITQADLGAMLEYHAAGGQRATLAVRRYVHTVPFGCVDLDGERVVRMEEKPSLSVLANAGIYVLDPHLLARIPRGQEFPLPGLLEQCLARGETVAAFEIEDDWIDVGQRDQLKQARGFDV